MCDSTITEQCIKSHKEISDFVELCRINSDEALINECPTFCEMNIALITTFKNGRATSSGQKQ